MKPMANAAKELDFVHTGPKDLAGKYLRLFWQPVFAHMSYLQDAPCRSAFSEKILRSIAVTPGRHT